MKYMIYLLLFCSIASQALADPSDDFSFSQTDKQTHVATSFGITLVSYLLLKKIDMCDKDALSARIGLSLSSFFLVTTLGILKEMIIDPEPSYGDIKANLIGSGMAIGTIFLFSF